MLWQQNTIQTKKRRVLVGSLEVVTGGERPVGGAGVEEDGAGRPHLLENGVPQGTMMVDVPQAT